MISKKKGEILKIGIFILIVIGSFLIVKISQACTVFQPLGPAACGGSGGLNCGFSQYGVTDAWLCGIEKVAGNYFCSDWNVPGSVVDPNGECQNNDVWLKNSSCPNTDNYNGNTCILADSAMNVWTTYHCSEEQDPWKLKGNWNTADKACVQCSGKTRSKLLVDTSKRCFNFTEKGVWPNSNLQWEEYACANDYAGKCDYGCGASLECNHEDDAVVIVPGGICTNCVLSPVCSWQNDGCDMGCNERDMHQTCGPPGCTDGECTAGETRCVPNHPSCIPCEETCACTCPAECPCGLGTCPAELRGGLVPCGKSCNDPCTKECECCPCTLCHLFVLFKKIVDFITIDVLFPLAVLMIVVGGVMFLTAAGDPGRIGTAKKILTSVIIGLVIVFLAWLIVDTIIMFITPANSLFQNWSTIDCPVP